MSAKSPILRINLEYLHEWAYRYCERVGMMCENREPTLAIRSVATAEANEWLDQELAYDEIDAELAF